MAREDEIRLIAYNIWEQEGCPFGKDGEHWFRAEKMLAEMETSEIMDAGIIQPPAKAAAPARRISSLPPKRKQSIRSKNKKK